MTANSDRSLESERIEDLLRAELARGDAMLASVTPVVRYLVSSCASSLFTESLIVRCRAMLADIVEQIVHLATTADQLDDTLAEHLLDEFGRETELLAFLHATAMEWELTERLSHDARIDPVRSPLLQALIGSSDDEIAASAVGLLAAQARFVQSQRRMQMPLHELPADCLDRVLRIVGERTGFDQEAGADMRHKISAHYDEGRSRLAFLSRLVFAMGGGAQAALAIEHAGVALFLTALATATGQERGVVALSTNENMMARLALILAASGLKTRAISAQFAIIHPDISLAEGVASIGSDFALDALREGQRGRT